MAVHAHSGNQGIGHETYEALEIQHVCVPADAISPARFVAWKCLQYRHAGRPSNWLVAGESVNFPHIPEQDTRYAVRSLSSHSGWVDIGPKRLFYWYQQARQSTPDTPVILWVQGGPGESSLIGALLETGACQIARDRHQSLRNNPHSWVEAAHIIYLEQDSNIGFSYDNTTNRTRISEDLNKLTWDIVLAIKMIHLAFPNLSSRGLHLIPALYEVGCSMLSDVAPVFNESYCSDIIALDSIRCKVAQDDCIFTSEELRICAEAATVCLSRLASVINGVCDPWDRSRCYIDSDSGQGDLEGDSSSNSLQLLYDIVSSSQFQESLFGESTSLRTYNGPVVQASGNDFATAAGSSLYQIRELLDGSSVIRILMYHGARDWLAAPGPAARAVEALGGLVGTQWKIRPWENAESLGWEGRIRKGNALWFAELHNAGRMVPRETGRGSLKLLQHWLHGDRKHNELFAGHLKWKVSEQQPLDFWG
ncbi:Alpha/Beta hydrolase protein [Xylogone sp. PMI_703]|nr:Alpha/Beta hydrolase protein [Xylogone sp. PMI_703]